MSLGGQWISRYEGSNRGWFVLDLDNVGDHYEGTAVAWDDKPEFPNSLIRIRTQSKAINQTLENIPVIPIDNNGDEISRAKIEQIGTPLGLSFPSSVKVELSLKGQNLEVKWLTSIETHGSGVATAPKTRAGQPSVVKPRRIKTWDGFKKCVNSVEPKRYIFRGQEDASWRLRSTFHRSGRANMERYIISDVADLQKVFSSITGHAFNLDNPLHYGAFLNLAQHHGYPTPLLDWTWSPYVAAFFAFRNIKANTKSDRNKRVRIYQFDISVWTKLNRAHKLFPIWRNVSILDALAFGNPRAIPQQSISTTSNVDDIESYIEEVGKRNNTTYLYAFELPASERDHAMQELALMGITAGALFPGLDGACESLRERNF